jgi:hypothetical protein
MRISGSPENVERERDAFNGTKDENGKTIERGIIYLRGEKAAEDLRSLMQQSMDARATKR